MQTTSRSVAEMPNDIIERLRAIRPRTIVFWTVVLAIQINLILIYLLVSDDHVTNLRYPIVYPLIWINTAIWVGMYARPVTVSRRLRVVTGAIGLGYFIILLVIPGRIALDGDVSALFELSYRWNIPGWGPIISLELSGLRATFVPYETIGYIAIAYLVTANLRRISRASLAGALGLVTCVGCTVPVLVPILGALGGTGTAVATVASNWFYDIGTVVFLFAIAILYHGHRPS